MLYFIYTSDQNQLTGLLIFRGKKSKIGRDFQGQICGKIGRFRGIFAEKSQDSRKIGRFCGIFAEEKSKLAKKNRLISRILAEKIQILKDFQGQIIRKIGRFLGKFQGETLPRSNQLKNSRFRWIFLASIAKIHQFCVDMTSVV